MGPKAGKEASVEETRMFYSTDRYTIKTSIMIFNQL